MATWYAQAAGDWDAVSGGTTSSIWFDAASGGNAMDIAGKVSGTTWTDTANTYILNGQAVNLKIATSVTCTILVAAIQAGAAAGTIAVGNSGAVVLGAIGTLCAVSSSYAGAMLTWGTGTCSLTVNGSLSYSSTFATGAWPVTTGQTIIVQNTGGAGTVAVLSSGTGGIAIVSALTGIVTISNSGGTAAKSTGSGYGVSMGGSGVLTITGNVESTSSGRGVYYNSSATTSTITGDISAANTAGGYGLRINGGSVSFVGNASNSPGGTAISITGGAVVWTGARTLAAATDCYIYMSGGTFNITSLVLSSSGRFNILVLAAATLTLGSGGTLAQINEQSTAAQSCIQGVVANIITHYGIYTYGDNDPAKVLTTATAAGTYQAVAASAVQKGVAVGVSPAVGTLVGIVDSAGAQHNYGTCSSTQAYAAAGIVHTAGTAAASGTLDSGGAYNATGVIYGAGSYATEASRNTDPGVAYVLAGHDYTIAGASKTAAYAPDFPAVANVLTTDTVDGSAGTYHAPETSEVAFGAVVGTTTGTYPLTATTQAADAAILEAQKDHLSSTETVTFGASSVVGTLDMGLYQLKTDSVLVAAISATIVKDGSTITATSGATHVDGTYSPGGTYVQGQTAQHATDAAFLETNKDEITTTDTNIFAEFGVLGTAVEGGGAAIVTDTEGDVYTSE